MFRAFVNPSPFPVLISNQTLRTVFTNRKHTSTLTMATPKQVSQVLFAREQDEGVGARVRRTIGSMELRNLDPFLLLDEFRVSKPAGFPE